VSRGVDAVRERRLGVEVDTREGKVGEAAQLLQQAELMVDAAAQRAVAVVESPVAVDEREARPAVHGLEKAVALQVADRRGQFGFKGLRGVEVMVIVQLDLAQTGMRGATQCAVDLRAPLFARIEKRVLWRPAGEIAMPGRQRA